MKAAMKAKKQGSEGFRLVIQHLSKSYGDVAVWRDLTLTLESGHTYCLMASSGSGKTTLLRILLGLEQADSGTIRVEPPTENVHSPRPIASNDGSPHSAAFGGISPQTQTSSLLRLTAVFQEDRLCEEFSPLDNVVLAVGRPSKSSGFGRGQLYRELARLLPEESILRPVSTLSGGMKRRVAIARAVLAPSDGILMDEPFTGLDEATKQTVIDYIKEKTTNKLLVVSTHQEEDVAALSGVLLRPF